jgi:hypothetical protein
MFEDLVHRQQGQGSLGYGIHGNVTERKRIRRRHVSEGLMNVQLIQGNGYICIGAESRRLVFVVKRMRPCQVLINWHSAQEDGGTQSAISHTCQSLVVLQLN